MGAARFGILGTLEIAGPDGPVEITVPQLRRLLCRLLVAEGRTVARSALYECLWQPGDDLAAGPSDPAGALRLYVSRLRRALPAGTVLRAEGAGFRLEVDPEDVDAGRFEQLIARAAVAGADAAAAVLEEALSLWRGDALAEFRDEPWAVGPGVRLDELRLAAEEQRYWARLEAGAAAELCGDLQQLVDDHPLRERFAALLMLALYRSGRQGEALRAYTRLRERLADELGIDPSPALAALESQILMQDASLDGRRPELPRRAATQAAAHNLPASATRFVGRADDLDRLAQLVPESRLVTLAGPPGAGKTRLAVQIASSLVPRYAGGVWFVELAGLAAHAPLGVLREVVASTVGVRLRHDETDDLEQALGARELMLVLDNCEHVIAAAADLCSGLLSACAGVTILTTSRELLRVPGEAVYRVQPLGLPPEGTADLSAIAASDATRLFVSLAKTHQPQFVLDASNADLVAGLCRRLDGLPLALEMAAARLRVLSLAQIHERLDARFGLLVDDGRSRRAHHRTLETLAGWSYDLLDRAEQALFRRLGAFAPGFDVDVVADFAGRVGAGGAVLDLLASLVDKSLVVADVGGDIARYRMLETIRRYAVDRLTETEGTSGDRAAREAHAACYLDRAERHAETPFTEGVTAWVRRTDADYDNLRAAIAHLSADADDALPAARLMLALRQFFTWSGRMPELRRMMEALGDRPELEATDLVTARYQLTKLNLVAHVEPRTALQQIERLLGVVEELPDRGLESEVVYRLSVLHHYVGDRVGAESLQARAMALARESGSYPALLRALMGVGATRGDVVEALDLARDIGDVYGTYQARHNLGYLALEEGDLAAARAEFEAALAGLEVAGWREIDTHAFNSLGRVLVMQGERDHGRELLARAYEAARRHQDQRAVSLALGNLAQCALLSAEYSVAAALLGACERHAERVGFAPADAALAAEVASRLREKLGDRRFESGREAGRRMTTDDVVDLATHLGPRPVPLREYA